MLFFFFFFQAEDGIRDKLVTGVQTCALPIWFEEVLKEKKVETGAVHDTDLTAAALKDLVARYKRIVKEVTGREFPDDPYEQLKMGINAVFNSWYGARAGTYRRLYVIRGNSGTEARCVAS